MATNPYMQNSRFYTGENNLLQDLVDEAIRTMGNDFVYLPRRVRALDAVFGEDNLSYFDTAYTIEMRLQNVDQWGGDGDFIGKFGLQLSDSAELVVSKRRWRHEVAEHESAPTNGPREGDLIYFPLARAIFEIKHVERENPFYQLGKNYIYTLKVEKWRYSHVEFKTGYREIDEIVSTFKNTVGNIVTREYGDNVEIELQADGIPVGDLDLFDDTGIDDRGPTFGGVVDPSIGDSFSGDIARY
jgi:hypothetical protein